MCRDAGLSRKPRGNEVQRHRARALRAQGLTLAQVAWEVGFSRSTIQRWLADSYDIPSNHEQDDTQ
ncbi:helix-turn-helix domain-containing protein [Actinomyces sp. W5033]|uniref:helix-turn-helix domain-containing protein n=1 Tax=Actinomyces sp. W5033 TaxID=3446479 RepID=UPI003EE141A8